MLPRDLPSAVAEVKCGERRRETFGICAVLLGRNSESCG